MSTSGEIPKGSPSTEGASRTRRVRVISDHCAILSKNGPKSTKIGQIRLKNRPKIPIFRSISRFGPVSESAQKWPKNRHFPRLARLFCPKSSKSGRIGKNRQNRVFSEKSTSRWTQCQKTGFWSTFFKCRAAAGQKVPISRLSWSLVQGYARISQGQKCQKIGYF